MWINNNYRKKQASVTKQSYRMELQDIFTTNRTYHQGGNLVTFDEAEERIAAKFIQNS